MWKRHEKIALASLGIALLSCLLAALTVREVRVMLGLPLDVAETAAEFTSEPPQQRTASPAAVPITPSPHSFTPPETRSFAGQKLHVQSATASSVLAPSRVAQYQAGMLLDGHGGTPWVENAPGYGVGEWVELQLGLVRTVTHLRFRNGYDKGARFRENGRIRGITATFSSGATYTFSLADDVAEQTIALEPLPIPTSFIRLTINSVYEGTRWEDTALGDVVVIGY